MIGWYQVGNGYKEFKQNLTLFEVEAKYNYIWNCASSQTTATTKNKR